MRYEDVRCDPTCVGRPSPPGRVQGPHSPAGKPRPRWSMRGTTRPSTSSTSDSPVVLTVQSELCFISLFSIGMEYRLLFLKHC